MMALILRGGPVMFPILACGAMGLFFVIERLLFLASRSSGARERIRLSLEEAPRPESRDACHARLALAVQAEVSALGRFVPTIGTLSTVATLLGLLGTVIGNIGAFGVLSHGGFSGDPGVLAGDISEALLTTAFGLSVSIPLLVAHNWLVSRVNREADALEQIAGRILEEFALVSGKSFEQSADDNV